MTYNIVINIIFLLISLQIFNKYKGLFFFFLPFLIQYVWMSFSLTVIENGVYISEQDRVGYFQYSNFYLLAFFILSFVSFTTGFNFASNKVKISVPKLKFYGKKNTWLTFAIAITALSLGLLNLFFSDNIYFDSNRGNWPNAVTKFNYWEKSTFPFLKSIIGNTIGFLPFIFGITIRLHRKKTIFFIILYLFYLIGIGQKFGPVLYAIISFMMSFYILDQNRNLIKKILNPFYLLIVGGFLFAVIYIKYSMENPWDHLGYSVIESVFQRAFGLQSHLFWGTIDRYVVSPDLNLSWDLTEINYGMHKLMRVFWPSPISWLEQTIASGGSFTNAYPAILLTIFPTPLAFIVHFFLFLVVGIIAGLIYNLVSSRKYIWATIFFQSYLWLIHAYTMSYFYKVYVVLLMLIFVSLVSFIFNKKRKDYSL